MLDPAPVPIAVLVAPEVRLLSVLLPTAIEPTAAIVSALVNEFEPIATMSVSAAVALLRAFEPIAILPVPKPATPAAVPMTTLLMPEATATLPIAIDVYPDADADVPIAIEHVEVEVALLPIAIEPGLPVPGAVPVADAYEPIAIFDC